MKEQPSQPSMTRRVLQQPSQPIERPYSRCSIGALVRLLNHTCGASAIHRGIREELCRRWALAEKTKPGEQPLLFTGAEWEQNPSPSRQANRGKLEPTSNSRCASQQQLCSGYTIRCPA